MARILRPPIIQAGIVHLAGYSLALIRRLKPVHIIVWAILVTICFTAIGWYESLTIPRCFADVRPLLGGNRRTGQYKKRLPALDSWDLLDFKDGKLTVPSDLQPPNPIRIAKANRFDNRYEIQHWLGGGYEGNAAVYRDMFTDTAVVVKTYHKHGYHPMTKPWVELFSNKVQTWPTEIPVTLLLTGLEGEHSAHNLSHPVHTFPYGLIPASDFFLAVSPISVLFPSWTRASWNLVTPFIPAGTLDTLALSIRRRHRHHPTTTLTAALVDSFHRPTFARLLTSLSALHARGYCHNDIKPDNILIHHHHHHPETRQTSSSWLLADLGQALPRTHPYLSSDHWAARSQWAGDCRLNDVRRALKSYLAFLRLAATPTAAAAEAFDRAFYAEREGWSRLYWGFVREPVGAEGMVARLLEDVVGRQLLGGEQEEDGGDVVERRWGKAAWWPWPADGRQRVTVLGWAVGRELTCTTVDGRWDWEGWRVWWALGGVWQRFPFERSLRDLVGG